jgi:hypothetical protein
MAADTVTTTALTLALTDDLADTPARGVERAVCDQSIREAAQTGNVTSSQPSSVRAIRDGYGAVSSVA